METLGTINGLPVWAAIIVGLCFAVVLLTKAYGNYRKGRQVHVDGDIDQARTANTILLDSLHSTEKRYNDLQERYDALDKRYQDLQSENERLRAEYHEESERLKAQLAELQREVEAFQAKVNVDAAHFQERAENGGKK